MRPLEIKNRLAVVISFTAGILLVWVYGGLYMILPIHLLLHPTISLIILGGIFYVMDMVVERFVTRRESSLVGKCPKCRYDLRASKFRCPECGTPIPSEEPARGCMTDPAAKRNP